MSIQFGTTGDAEETTTIPAGAALCTAILQIDVTDPVVNDVLWRNFYTREVGTYASPSRDGAISAVFSLNSIGLESLGRSIKDPEVLLEVSKHRPHPNLWQGAATNPRIDEEGLTWLSQNAGGSTLDYVERRLKARSNLTSFVETGEGYPGETVEDLLATNDASGIAAAYRHGGELAKEVAERLTGQCDIHVRQAVLDALGATDQAAADRLYGQVMETAEVVDKQVLQWVKSSQGWDAELFRAMLFPDNGESPFAKELANRLDESAAYWALELGEMPHLAALGSTQAKFSAEWYEYEGPEVKRKDVVAVSQNADTQRGNIMAWTAMGMSPDAIASMIFNSYDGIPHDELLEVVAMGGTTQIAEYLCGAKKRRMPRKGDAAAIWEQLDLERKTFAVAAIASYPDLGKMPWSAELVLVAPKILAKDYSPTLVWATVKTFLNRIEDDANAWEVAISLLGDWNGTLDELVEMSRTIVPAGGHTRWANTTEDVSRMLFGEA